MTREGQLAWVVTLAVACACGEVVTPNDDAGETGAGGAGGDGGGGTGATTQGGGGSIGLPECPTAPPVDGAPCEAFGETCTWGAGECLYEAMCTGGGWQVGTSGICNCPVELPNAGAPCETVGRICEYAAPGDCAATFAASCGDGSWSVFSDAPGCDFTCPDWPDETFLESPCDPCCHHPCMGGESCSYYFATCVDGMWQDTYTPC